MRRRWLPVELQKQPGIPVRYYFKCSFPASRRKCHFYLRLIEAERGRHVQIRSRNQRLVYARQKAAHGCEADQKICKVSG